MIISNTIFIISLLLDGILTNFLPYMVSDLSYFTPLLTLTSLVIVYPLFKKEKKKFMIFSFVSGMIYDLFYTNLLFFNGFLFLLLSLIIIKLYEIFGGDYLKILFHILIIIILYETFTALLIIIFNLVPMNIDKLIYKISHSILLNLIYGEVVYFILKRIPKKYLKVPLN